MSFNSAPFFLFFAAFLLVYHLLSRRWQNLWIVAASYFFYGWWDWRFCGLLLGSAILDYYLGFAIEKGKRPRFWVTVSIVVQLAALAWFKYFNFFEESFARLTFALMGWRPSRWTLDVVLPVGISFYTFQTLSYTVDIYRKRLRPSRSFIEFAAFVSFWPHLVAGPILRASFMLPQMAIDRRVTQNHVREGAYFIFVGLVKKVAVADLIAPLVDSAVKNPAAFSSWQLLLSIYLFSFRIYGDFSGYTDIARGVSLLMGFRLPDNFRWPYFAQGIRDFWRRWHISLSTWLRDYLYVSLGGNRGSRVRTSLNLMTTMVLGGLWHGANWTFVVWGALHGFYLVIAHHLKEPWARLETALPRHFRHVFRAGMVLATFHLVTFTWIFFVSPDFSHAASYVRGLCAFTFVPDAERVRLVLWAIVVLLLLDLPEFLNGTHAWLADRSRALRAAVYTMCLVLIIMTWTSNYEPFIYFQF